MISKEFAIAEFLKYEREFSQEERAEELYSMIKYSIGSCGECEHWKENYWSKNKPYGCSWMELTFMDEDWYCADFKRKQS